MSVILHKYTPEQMSEEELVATFAAREHTLEFLLNGLREQVRSGTLSSYLVTGPRGAGKSALLRMLRIRIRKDAQLDKAWCIVRFPEEQFNVATVRDLLAEALRLLGEQGVASAQEWLRKVEAETDDEQSETLAVAALKKISQSQKRRFLLFVENLDDFFDCLTDTMKGALRRLLMVDPFMLIIGSAVHMFGSLQEYDEAFFNYFCHVPLPRLDEAEIQELLRKRAEFDRNESFLRELPRLRSKILALTHLTGGNPRFVLMVYELLEENEVATIVQELRRLVDELTPLLKHTVENLPPQQQKIIHALMEKGGTATPAEIASLARLSLNAVTAQLRRLKESQILELRGGGKGQPAYYTVPDQLFSIWYQMRYLNQRRRQIELFVEVLRIWFEEEERLRILSSLSAGKDTPAQNLRETATTAEYYAVSLTGTPHEEKARDLALRQWLKIDLREAALAHAEFARIQVTDEKAYEAQAHASLGEWFLRHNDPKAALLALAEAVKQSDTSYNLVRYGVALSLAGDNLGAMKFLDKAAARKSDDPTMFGPALINRGVIKVQQGDTVGAIADYSVVIGLSNVPVDQMANALLNRGAAKAQQGDMEAAITDYSAVIKLVGVPVSRLADALFNRGVAKSHVGNAADALMDYTAAVELEGAPVNRKAQALINRGVLKGNQGDIVGELADYAAVIEMVGAPKDQIAKALVNRATVKALQGDAVASITDCTAVIELEGVPSEQLAVALFNRGVSKHLKNDSTGALADWIRTLDVVNIPPGILHITTGFAYRTCWLHEWHEKGEMILTKLNQSVRGVSTQVRLKLLIDWLAALASPDFKEGWIVACRYLVGHQEAEVAEVLGFFEPVCVVLETGDRSVLDRLSPEQRELATKVLTRFDSPQKPTGS